jgi:branched-chain amino acid transport system ATP-binding protein
LVTVIGSNGAGKTTLPTAVIGLLNVHGTITFGDAPVASIPLEARVKAGMCLVPERRELFGDMPVEDNLRLGRIRHSRAERNETLEQIFTLFPRLKDRREQLAGSLSGGELRCWRRAAR